MVYVRHKVFIIISYFKLYQIKYISCNLKTKAKYTVETCFTTVLLQMFMLAHVVLI